MASAMVFWSASLGSSMQYDSGSKAGKNAVKHQVADSCIKHYILIIGITK
jgi:hypothetical protein